MLSICPKISFGVQQMKIMLFCWAQEITNEILHAANYFSEFEHQFILTPLIRFKDKSTYAQALTELSETSQNILVAPIYLKSPNSNFSNLLNPNTLMRDFLSIRKVVKRSKPDVVICFYILHDYPLAFLKKLSGFSLCTVAMGSDVNLDNGFLQKLAKNFVYRNSDLIFARSWKLKDVIEEEHNRSVIVSPSSTDTSFFKPLNSKTKLKEKWSINVNAQVILTVCRLDKNKGVDVLLKSLGTAKKDNLKVLVVGDGEERKALEELSSALDLREQVVFMGLRSKMELLELYNLSDLFVLTSYSEGLPRVLLEAMACGCVPVVTDVGSVNAAVINGGNGFIVEPGNYLQLAEKVEKVLEMPEQQLRLMQTRARQKVIDNFDSKKIWQSMIDSITTSPLIQHNHIEM
jgi:glycosyltransferase involved in cell wall biosynthesis